MTTSVLLLSYTSIHPLVAEGTMAALATIVPVRSFSVDTTGWGWPVGHTDSYLCPPGGTTVIFSE
jgi:hypothetical protein